ncbi:DUF4214 domain-containing protein, partial [Massilia sp. Root335]|uniref:DUF4214 domain-containing protein n=1 Tax=Massilia sp. Root335 TaxID=1736517 RepID=UPI001E5909A2
MKQRLNIASNTRINALLCSSAAVLLAACGAAGAASAQTTAHVYTITGAGPTSEPNAAGAASKDFALTGYDINPLAGAGSLNGAIASAAAGAAGTQPRLLAGVTAANPSSSAVTTATAQVTQLYQSLLGRAPDAAGLAYWSQAVASGVPLSAVEAAIRSSAEYMSLHNTTGSTVTVPATPYNYYVSPTGSDTAAGTKAAPFKTL